MNADKLKELDEKIKSILGDKEPEDLTNEELDEILALQDEKAKLEEEKEVQELTEDDLRAIDEATAPKDEVEPQKVDKLKSKEVRDFAKYLKTPTELRDEFLGRESNGGGSLVPKVVSQEVIKRIYKYSPVYAEARRVQGTGVVSVPVEGTSVNGAKFLAELEAMGASEVNLDSVELTIKRIVSSQRVTRELMLSTDFDIINFLVERVAEDIARGLTTAILTGKGITYKTDDLKNRKTFGGVLQLAGTKLDSTFETGKVNPDLVIDLYDSLHKDYLDGAMWVVDNKTKAGLMKMQDGDKKNLMFNPAVKNVTAGVDTLLGLPVYVDDSLSAKAEGIMVLGNFNKGYTIFEREGLDVNVVDDEEVNLSQGVVDVFATVYADGAVTCPEAFAIARIKQ